MQVTLEQKSREGARRGGAAPGALPRYRNRRAALTLVVLGPLVAELALGSTPVHLAFLLVLWLPVYGAGVLLIREAVVRSGGGWPSVMLLGVAYELAEDGIGLQALSSPHLYHAADWAPRLLGINTAYWEVNLVYHVVFSVTIPILLADLIFPAGRGRAYLGQIGFVVTAVAALSGVAMLRLSVPPSQDPGYTAPVTVLSACVLAVVLVAVVALWLLPRGKPRSRSDETVPPPPALWLIGGAGAFFFMALLFPFAGAHQPAFTHGSWVLAPMAAAAGIIAGLAWLIRRWSSSRSWGDAQMLSLAGGALIAHTAFGIIGVVHSTIDRAGLLVLGLLTVWLLAVLTKRLQSAAVSP